jgi:site-specific DNA-methyltransferase (adenine-specific)
MEYLVKTYTDENDLVLDNTMGSCSTGNACLNTNRKFIGIEKEKEYYEISVKRIEDSLNELNSKPKGLF